MFDRIGVAHRSSRGTSSHNVKWGEVGRPLGCAVAYQACKAIAERARKAE